MNNITIVVNTTNVDSFRRSRQQIMDELRYASARAQKREAENIPQLLTKGESVFTEEQIEKIAERSLEKELAQKMMHCKVKENTMYVERDWIRANYQFSRHVANVELSSESFRKLFDR